MQKVFKLKALVAAGGVAVFALLAAPVMTAGHVSLISVAQAEESHTDSGGHEGGKGSDKGAKKGKGGSHESGAGGASKSTESVLGEEEEGGKGSMGSGTHGKGSYQDKKMSGGGKGGPSADSDAKGPRYSGGASTGSKGGKPVWAQEGLYEDVELARLNVARAPDSVFARQIAELKTNLTPVKDSSGNLLTSVSVKFDNAGRLVVVTKDLATGIETESTVDSPLTNLAMFENLVKTGSILGVPTTLAGLGTLGDGTVDAADLSAAAKFLGAAADKTVPVLPHTVVNIDRIMEISKEGEITVLNYDRSTAFSAEVYNTVFKNVNVTKTGTDGFAQAADDARAVIQYYHDN